MAEGTTRRRILHCIETCGSGGVEQRRLILARGLDPERYEQALVCTQAIGELPESFREAGCTIHEVGVLDGIFDVKPYKKTLDVVKKFRPYIVHGAVFEGVALAAVAGRLGRVPIILGEETSDPVNRRLTGHLLYRLLAGLTHQMVAVSPAVKQYLVNRIHLPPTKVSLINNGVSIPGAVSEEQIALIRARHDLKPEHFVVGTVSRLQDSHKRVSDLIRAFSQVRERLPTAVLLIVGSGPDESMLHQLARELGIADSVRFAGYQATPASYYAVMDVFALASAHEAFGLVLVEAMFAGLPVVATRVGGIPSVVEEGVTGYLVLPFQPLELAERVITLGLDPVLRRTMGWHGLGRARERFEAQRYLDDVDRLYRQLVTARLGG